MEGYLIIYVKKDSIGHVRYEIGDNRGYKEIRGLSQSKIYNGITIYEKGEEDSHGISVYDKDSYSASDKIPLEREELLGAMVYTRDNDDEHEEYSVISQNCNDFTSGVLSAAGQEGCVGDYLSKEQKEGIRLSQGSDLVKCRIPKKVKETTEKTINFTKELAKQACSGIVNVSGYERLGHSVSAYVRSCGRH